MKMEKIKMEMIKPAKYNPRVELEEKDENYQRIKASIESFGLVDPLIINKRNMTLIGGHQRYNILKELNYKEVDCIVLNLDDKREKELNLSLNKNSGFWDNQKLKDVFDELNLTEEELFTTGFSQEDINNLQADFIEDLLLEDFASTKTTDLSKFAMTFNIDKVYEEKFIAYVKLNGKDKLIALMTAEVMKEVN